MIFGRKWVLWTPESTQKAYIEHPTQFGHIFQKAKKNRIFDHQNRCKKIFSAEFSGRCGPATKAIPGINTPYTCPQIPIILMYGP